MIAKEIIVYGTVQGVGFRYYTYKKANMLGIKGFVRNEPDGSVYIEAVAPNEQAMQTFIDYIERGPSLARVKNIIVSDIPVQEHKEFKIF